MEYGAIAIHNTNKTNIQILQRIQNHALRIALRKPMRTSIKELHELADIEMIEDRLLHLANKTRQKLADRAAEQQ